MPVLNRMHILKREGQYSSLDVTQFYQAGNVSLKVRETARHIRTPRGGQPEYEKSWFEIFFFYPGSGWVGALTLKPDEAESSEVAASIALRVTGANRA